MRKYISKRALFFPVLTKIPSSSWGPFVDECTCHIEPDGGEPLVPDPEDDDDEGDAGQGAGSGGFVLTFSCPGERLATITPLYLQHNPKRRSK
jgi:hypothetical protein